MQIKIELIKDKALDIQNELTAKLHLCFTPSGAAAFRLFLGNSHNAM